MNNVKIDIRKLTLCWGMKSCLKKMFKSHIIALNLTNLKRYAKWQARKRYYSIFWYDMAKLCRQLDNRTGFGFAVNKYSKLKQRNRNNRIPNDKLIKRFIKIFSK